MLTDAQRRREAQRVIHIGSSDALDSELEAELVASDVREEGEACEIRTWGDEWRVLLGPFPDPAA